MNSKKQFSDAGKTRFGSGWAWLCMDNKRADYIDTLWNVINWKVVENK